MRLAWIAWAIILLPIAFAQDSSELPPYRARAVDNYPYVVSDAEGRFYARAIPADDHGTTGSTNIYRVGETHPDKLLATYEWYARPQTLVLCGNPDTNEVAVVLHNFRAGLRIRNPKNDTALRFFAGGRSLMTYRAEDLAQFGVKDRTY